MAEFDAANKLRGKKLNETTWLSVYAREGEGRKGRSSTG